MSQDQTEDKDIDVLRDELKKLKHDNDMLAMNVDELTTTNTHLISATWRERELKQELQSTKELVDRQHKSITDSINYAKRIQHALIPKFEEIQEEFKDSFMYFKAKDVVSGDFPWLYVRNKFVYIAAVDCTGHGVPGAMMSLIGHLLLNDLVSNYEPDPALLLTNLHWAVVKTLKQDVEGNETADGMDIAMCRIDIKSGEVQYSGAHRPLYHVRNKELTQYKGDKYPIGGNQYEGKNSFQNHIIPIEEGDAIYFFSDGLPDQFGGPNKLKFGPKKIRNILTENTHLTMEEQKNLFETLFTEWQGDEKQVDDLLMIGIKF